MVVDFAKLYEDRFVKAINYLPLTINNNPEGEYKYKYIIHGNFYFFFIIIFFF